MQYYSEGHGDKTIIFLPGSLGAGSETASILSGHLSGKRIIVATYPPVKTVSELLDLFDEILHTEKIESFALYGGSFGGLLAQAWVRRHPNRISHLILSGSAPPDPNRIQGHMRALRILKFIPLWVLRALLKLLLFLMLRNTKGTDRWKGEYQRLIRNLSKQDLAARYWIALDLDKNYHYSAEDLPDNIPVLILEGERDRVAKKTVREQLRSLYPNAETHVIASAGHAMMITNTVEWSQTVTDFLADMK